MEAKRRISNNPTQNKEKVSRCCVRTSNAGNVIALLSPIQRTRAMKALRLSCNNKRL